MRSTVATRSGRLIYFAIALAICTGASMFPSIAGAQSRSIYIEDLTWPEVRDAIKSGKSTAIIYTGSTEQNGPHMAIGKHNFLARYIAGQIALRLGNALVYPTLPVAPTGDADRKSGHMRFPGSVTLNPSTYRAVVHDIAQSAAVAGFSDVVLMGDHGEGQDQLAAVARELDTKYKSRGVRVFFIPDLYTKAKAESRAFEVAHGIHNDIHAGTDDTSELMAIDAQHRWIRASKLAASDAAHFATTGVSGDPTKASVALGIRFIGYKVDAAVAQIQSLTRH